MSEVRYTRDDYTGSGVGFGAILGIIIGIIVILLLAYFFWYRPTYIVQPTTPDVNIQQNTPQQTTPNQQGDTNIDLNQQAPSGDTTP